MTQYRIIGKRLPRVDAKDKVTGKALYTDDLSLPGILCGVILRSPLPHARLAAVDVSKALLVPGVKAMVTGDDMPKIKYGIISRSPKYMDEYPLAVEKVRFIGEEVAAVAAVDADAALDINPDNIRVIKPHVGGGFGGKSDGLSAVEFCAALLARHADRPVKIVCSRDEEFMATRRKHPIKITMKTGIKKAGANAYGIGLGCGGFPSGTGFYFNKTTSAHSAVIIRVGEGGGISVFTGASDIGQGPDSVICQIVAEVLGLPLEDIHLTSADTHLTPPDMGTYSSRLTLAAGNAALTAANKVRAELCNVVSEALEANPDDLAVRDRKIHVKGSPERFVAFADTVNLYQKKNKGAPLVAEGAYNSPDPLSPTYSFGAYICEVAVSLKTGEVRVKKFTVAHDCGQPLNPKSVEGQIEGCIGMGIGYAISEQLISENGRTMNPSFSDYGVPTADRMPEIRITHIITNDPRGPFGAKETGEGSQDPAAPAIANAVYNATGVQIKELPITAEKILNGLRVRR